MIGCLFFFFYWQMLIVSFLIQQVGRLIRSHNCWGEVVIYDKRLLTKNYGARLLNALPVFPIEQPGVPEVIVKRKAKQTAKQTGRKRR